jgi:hypothetical protein
MSGTRQGDKPMGESTASLPPKASGSWMAYQVAFTKLLTDLVGPEPGAAPAGEKSAAASSAELKKTVTDAVTAVLFETKILERVIDRQIKAQLAAASAAKASEGGSTGDAVRQEIPKIVKEYLTRNLGQLFEGEVRGAIQKEILSFMASDQMKEIMDDKFRLINSYLKSEVIPKVVQQELARA